MKYKCQKSNIEVLS